MKEKKKEMNKPSGNTELSKIEQEAIRERLRQLGYL